MPSVKTPDGRSFQFDHNQRAQFQAQLRFGDGGTLIRDFNKAQLTGDFMLVVGLGGLGTKAVSRIKTAVKRECDGLYQDRIQYLAFDTDAGALQQLCETDHSKVGLELGTEAVQIGNGVTGAAADLAAHAAPCIKEWLNPKLSVTFGGDGAGGCRQGGRFLLTANGVISTVMGKLHSTITKMAAAYGAAAGSGAQFIVVLAAGIAGGTGAGTFVDMAYLIRNELKNTVPTATLNGYLFLPDVLDGKVSSADPYSKVLRRNAYASLKELDRYMRIKDDQLIAGGAIPGNQAEYVMEYPGNIVIRSKENIFDFCTFVCGKSDAAGAFTDPQEKALSTAASSIVEALKAVPKVDANGMITETLLSSVMSNKGAAGTAMAATLPANLPRDADYRYQAIGFGSARLPIEECVAYVGDKLFDKMWQQWDRTPNQQAVINFCVNTALDPTSVRSAAITATYDLFEESSWPSQKDAENSSLVALQTNFKGRVEAFMAAKAESWQKVLEARKNKFDTEAQGIFMDPNCGPHYLVRLLAGYMNDGDLPLVDYIQTEYIGMLRGKVVDAQTRMRQMEINKELGSAYIDFAKAWLLKGKAYKDLMNVLAKYYTEYEKVLLAETQIDFYNSLINYIISSNNKVWSVYTTVIGECADLLKDNANIATNAGAKITIGGSSYSWTIVDLKNRNNPETQRLLTYLNSVVNGTNMNAFLNNMVAAMSNKREAWTSIADNQGADALAAEIRAFLRSQLGSLVSMNIDSFITAAYVDNTVADPAKAKLTAARNIYNTVSNAAVPIFRSTPQIPLGNFLQYNYLSVPDAAPALLANMTALANTGVVNNVYSSTAGDKVVWYTLVYGIPPYALGIIKECEEEYYNMISVDGAPGLQLSENTASRVLDWRSFANPFNKAIWSRFGIYTSQTHLNAREAEAKTLIEKALEYGIIEQTDATGGTVFNMTFIPAIGQKLSGRENIADGKAVPMDALLAKLAINGTMVFDRKAYIDNLLAANKGKKLTVGANLYKDYAKAYGVGTGAAAVTAQMKNLYDYYKPVTVEMLENELRASLERQLYLEVAIADYEEVLDAVRAHNDKAAEGNLLPFFADCLKLGVIFNEALRKTWFYSDGQTRNNGLCSYVTGAPLDKRYPEFFAFRKFCAADGQVKTKLQKVLAKEATLRTSDLELAAQDAQRAESMKEALESIIYGEEHYQFGSFDIDDDLSSINALDKKDEILSFYKSLYTNLGI